MLSFRKLFVLMAIVVAMAAVASAQQCAVNAGAPTIARQEGVAEEVGQVLLTCTGGTPTHPGLPIPNNINVQIYLNTQVTSRLLTNDGWSEALLLLDEPTSGNQKFCNSSNPTFDPAALTCRPLGVGAGPTSPYAGTANTFQGKYNTAVPNSMTFNGIPFDAPGTQRNLTMRIVNIRANASAITSSSFIPGNITMFIAITGTGAPGIGNNAQSVVAFVQKGLAFSLRTTDDKSYTSASLSQCNDSNPGAPDAGKGCVNFRLRFSELFGTAFRPKQSLPAQDSPGTIYNTEGMYYNNAWTGGDRGNLALIGLATQGTRLSATFTNIPAGVRVFVTDKAFNGSSSALSDIVASRSSVDGSSLKTGTTSCSYTIDVVPNPTPPPTTTVVSGSIGYTEVTSSGVATWEVTSAQASATSSVDFGVLVVYSASGVTPTSTATQVTGNYAPINTQSPIMAARGSDESSSGYPLPRFVSSGIAPIDAFTIAPCRTNLLFPFVTNQAGFDTGIAISNTSMAPTGFTGSQQSGACTINFYGQTTGGGQAPSAQTSASIPAGGQLVFTLSAGGGVLGSSSSINPAAGFQGYIIAQCNFQFAHGFAFVSDLSATKLAEGYLALVLDSGISSRTGSASETLNN